MPVHAEIEIHVYSLFQKHEEAQSNNLVSTADIDNETIIKLVSEGVTAIFTRLQSESLGYSN